MKKSIYLYLLLVIFYFSGSAVFAQLLVEDFNYTAGQNLSGNGWTVLAEGGTNPVTITNPGLNFSGYSSSGIGNAALMDNLGEDVYRTFPAQTSGSVYVSFMLNVSSYAQSYFFYFASSADPGTGRGRVVIRNPFHGTGDYSLGISHSSSGTQGSISFDLIYGQTYVVIMKYTFVPGSTTNDEVRLYVFSSNVPASEPTTPETGPFTGIDAANIGSIVLRQFSASHNMTIDGIRVSTAWNDVLPVELTSFTYNILANGVELSWLTETETNNFGFEVQRKSETKEWEKIGFVEGYGTTVKAHSYHFTDETELRGSYLYRLKQIDTDGNFEFSPTLTVAFGIPESFDLAQNYPNPFNPSTSINYSIASESHVQLTIFDVLGKTVRTLVDENRTAGHYSLIWNGRNDAGKHMPSGTYFYQLRVAGNPEMTRQMLLIK